MIIYERNAGLASNLSFTFDFGNTFPSSDCHTIELNQTEDYLLLLGNHELQFINFDLFLTPPVNTITDENSIIIPCASETTFVPLFDHHNINRPIVRWNSQNSKQFALAIDRLVRFYSIDYGRIQETNSIVDTQHQRPISTISYNPNDPNCFLTGALDGHVQIWDIRHCSWKTPANLKLTLSTPFSIRQIQWAGEKSNSSNYLAIQCDRCIRIYDMRRTDTYLSSIEHSQRIINMDWTIQNHSLVTLSKDNSLRIFSTSGQLLAESIPNEQLPFSLNKVQTTEYDSLFICSSQDSISSTYGFTSWRWDEDHYVRPLTDQIVSTCPLNITDFRFVTHSRFFNLYNLSFPSRSTDDLTKHFPILTWCRDDRLRLVDMDATFRQTWQNYIRLSKKALSDSTSMNSSRQQYHRTNSTKLIMSAIEDEITDLDESDRDESTYPELLSPLPPVNGNESSETGDESDISFTSEHLNKDVSIANEFSALQATYGPYITMETKDEQHRMCILRCTYPFERSESFRISLFLSRHYPIISQLYVRFKFIEVRQNDERWKNFQTSIQTLLDETSYQCFYHGQLCLPICLLKLQHLFHLTYKREKRASMIITGKPKSKQCDQRMDRSDQDSLANLNHNNHRKASHRIHDLLASSPIRLNEIQSYNGPPIRSNPRTCGARFSGGVHLICFGRTCNNVQQSPTSAPPIMSNLNDGILTRPSPFHMRSISMTASKSRGNSGTDDQPSSYRSSVATTLTNTIQSQSNGSLSQRMPMFSAPMRSSLGSSLANDHPRISTSLHRSFNHHLTQTNSIVSIYDVSILLPISKKLADDYKLDLTNLIDMCQANQKITKQMAKYELSHCWRLLAGLLSIQSTLPDDHIWFQTPIAQGLIKHLIVHSITHGDIQSASMFLLTTLQTSFMKRTNQNDHLYDSILYSYASLLHRWKHFYKRAQILQRTDHNCQSPTVINQVSTSIICSICLQPVLGQHFLCAICAHGGHLIHMHDWFSSTEMKHRYCPEKDCTCRCIIKQQELLTINTDHIQKHQHTPTLTPKPYYVRNLSTSMNHL
ncbi:unnamed protein product [Adineta ricciae]|uniref:Uncharacterized protein n=1 Tax=Adineta ricciae TaxID=249248 RepID=A0A813Z4K5_ADIRI|nr:unnamed protein product [Adineta ricciae]CAF1203865.1 unnamed protein product [Adineta ricciae]